MCRIGDRPLKTFTMARHMHVPLIWQVWRQIHVRASSRSINREGGCVRRLRIKGRGTGLWRVSFRGAHKVATVMSDHVIRMDEPTSAQRDMLSRAICRADATITFANAHTTARLNACLHPDS
jgi:hypothetical protein